MKRAKRRFNWDRALLVMVFCGVFALFVYSCVTLSRLEKEHISPVGDHVVAVPPFPERFVYRCTPHTHLYIDVTYRYVTIKNSRPEWGDFASNQTFDGDERCPGLLDNATADPMVTCNVPLFFVNSNEIAPADIVVRPVNETICEYKTT